MPLVSKMSVIVLPNPDCVSLTMSQSDHKSSDAKINWFKMTFCWYNQTPLSSNKFAPPPILAIGWDGACKCFWKYFQSKSFHTKASNGNTLVIISQMSKEKSCFDSCPLPILMQLLYEIYLPECSWRPRSLSNGLECFLDGLQSLHVAFKKKPLSKLFDGINQVFKLRKKFPIPDWDFETP